MATSGTYAFGPATSDLMLQAFGRCQIRRPQLTPEMMADAAICANLVQVQFSNRGVNLWTVELDTQLLVEDQATYNLDAQTISIMSAYISTGSSPATDRIITSISRDDYAAFPDKETSGTPTVYWMNRQIAPTITIWQPPDDNGPYTLKYYRARQMQDAKITAGLTTDVPYRFLEAYIGAWAAKIAEIYAPAEFARLTASAAFTWKEAADSDVENVPLTLSPDIGSYMRGVM